MRKIDEIIIHCTATEEGKRLRLRGGLCGGEGEGGDRKTPKTIALV